MNRNDITPILADIEETINRVRDLSVSPERAAALHCLSVAKMHLGRVQASEQQRLDRSERDTEPMLPVVANGVVACWVACGWVGAAIWCLVYGVIGGIVDGDCR